MARSIASKSARLPMLIERRATGSTLQGLEIRYQVSNLAAVQLKLGHSRVRGPDTLGERLHELLDRIAEVKHAEWRRDPQRAFSGRANCMT